MNHEIWLAQADTYALGALDGEDLRGFEAHLRSGCAACAERLRETSEALTALPRALAPLAPSPAVKARLMDAIARERPTVAPPSDPRAPRESPRWVWWGGWATALAAAAVLVVVGWSLSTTRDELDRLRGRVAVLQDQLTEREATLRFLSDPRVRYVSLAGAQPSPGSSGWLLWIPETRQGLFLSRGLPPAPSDRTYALWAIATRSLPAAGKTK